MKKLLIAVLVLVPAVAVGQQKYTNADLEHAPRQDAYTNADLKNLAPLPAGQLRPLQPIPPVRLSRASQARAEARADLFAELDSIEAEMRYWREIQRAARYPGVDRNAYPRFGSDTAEARQRLKELARERVLVLAEDGFRR
ncbi:MAG: hypothetical protein ACE5ID_06090 [Acidobacteriota bacterium]